MSRKFLNPEAIAQLKGLELRARMIVSGVLSGMHRSAYRGYSVEFAEHRQYVPGDDIRHIDWRLYGRKDRYYIKQYEEETNLTCHLLVDASESMAYGSGALSKYEYACCLGASIGYLLTTQQDACGLTLFDEVVRATVAPGTGRAHLTSLLSVLEQNDPAQHTDVKVLLHRLAGELRRRSVVVVLSDLLTDPAELTDGLEHLAHAGHELIVLHVLDRDEWQFTFHENVYFEGIEEDARLLADAQTLRRGYLAAVERFVNQVKGACLKHNADYVRVDTHDPLDVTLSGYLALRSSKKGRV